MGGGSYSTNNRVNAAVAAAAAARASTPVISDPIVNLPVKSAVSPVQEEVVSLASPFETEDPFVSTVDQAETIAAAPQASIADLYNNWLLNTEQGQRSPITGYTPPVEVPASASGTNAATIESIPPEQLARLQEMDLSFGNDILGLDAGNIAKSVSMFSRENQYENITKYNPVGTAPEDMVVYDDLNSSEAKAAKAAREKEVTDSLQEWTQPLKELSKSDSARFTEEYNQLPIDARLAYLRNEYDQGSLTKREYQDAFAEQWNNSEKKEIGVLQFIEKYGYRMNSPDAIAQQGGQDQQGARDWYEADKVFGGDKGEAGDYSYLGSFTPTVKETFDPTSFGRALEASGPFRAALAIMTGGVSEGVVSATKGLTGDTLHAGDWLSIASAGLHLADVITPPAKEAAAAEAGQQAMQAADAAGLSNAAAMQAGNAAQATALAGKGLTIGNKALTYNQSVGLLNVAAGNPTGAALQLYGGDLINEGLDKIGLDQAAIEGAGIQYDDFQAGIGKTVQKLAEGVELDDALAHGLGKYIREGGTLGSIDLPSVDLDIDLGGLGAIIEPIVEAAEDIGRHIVKAVEDVGRPVVKTIEDVGRPVVKTIEDIGRPVVKTIEDIGRPVVKTAEDVAQAGGDIIEDVAQAGGDILSAVDTAIREALPNTSIDLPDVNLPDVNLPNVNLPNVNLNPSLNSSGMLNIVRSPTATTDQLFGDELFKFKTQVGIEIEEPEYVDLDTTIENFFDNTRLRSYEF